jgi:hypothetical protein
MDLPQIVQCGATECAYNRERNCHAAAITVGYQDDARCDTFVASSHKGGLEAIGGVGACKIVSCQHNRDLLCTATGIRIDWLGDRADCQTYAPIGSS